jgi:hypothetical protein
MRARVYYLGIGFAVILANAMTCIITFLMAYANGGTVPVIINDYNEAITELILLIVSTPFMVYYIIYSLRNLAKEQIK